MLLDARPGARLRAARFTSKPSRVGILTSARESIARHLPPLLLALSLTPTLALGLTSAAPAGGLPPSPGGRFGGAADPLDRDGDGVEDLLRAWADGAATWGDLQEVQAADGETPAGKAWRWPAGVAPPAAGPLAKGEVRLLRLGGDAPALAAAQSRSSADGGALQVLHRLQRFGGVEVLAADPSGLRALLAAHRRGRLLLDRDGRPALDRSGILCGAVLARQGPWQLDGDWTASVAILDSGCDTAHDDLGDFSHDNRDGPPPAVGDALDWSSAAAGWPLFLGYKVIGWRDVTDDFPLAAGPWDYHYHGTALAGVVAGAGVVDSRFKGIAPSARLTIVKFYDFDGVWRQWAGDFLAACDWLLANREACRVRVALCAVNWDVDAGISAAMAELVAAGILPVAAIGNEGEAGGQPGWPARLSDVLTVGAVDDAARLAAYSVRGGTVSSKPDLVAPGGARLESAGWITTADNDPDDSYSPRRGTSLAAAHAAAGALLLLEGLRKEGVSPPAGPDAVRLTAALLKATAAPVLAAETPDGLGSISLSRPGGAPDSLQGWGMLQIAAAVEGALQPLPGGTTARDSLGGTNARRTIARRLTILPNVACTIQAVPTSGLDVALEVHDTRTLLDPLSALGPIHRDDAPAGGTERCGYVMPVGALAVVAVKWLGGVGSVTLSVTEQPSMGHAGFGFTMSGQITGWANSGTLQAGLGPSLVLTGLVDVDPQARQLHALDASGRERPGWPVTLFLPPISTGQLTAPLVWDLDGSPGDEVVAASGWGRIYFATAIGALVPVDPGLGNVALTAPVGRVAAGGAREIDVISQSGLLVRLSSARTVIGTQALGAANPRAPAVGEINGAPGEELVVSFAGGLVTAVGEGGAILAGWPRDLGASGLGAPALADLDGDGRHEILVAHLGGSQQDRVVFRVLEGDGQPAAADGTVALAPDGGRWLALSDPAVARSWGSGALLPVVTGLTAAGSVPDSVLWRVAMAALVPGGGGAVTTLPGCSVRGLTPAGSLQLRWALLPAPLAWNWGDGPDTETDLFVGLGWEEVIPGNPNLRGALSAWLRPGAPGAGPTPRLSPWPGGPAVTAPTGAGAALVAAGAADTWTRVTHLGARLVAQPTVRRIGTPTAWASQRADGRNSGAYPLGVGLPTAAPQPTGAAGASLAIWPNPASGPVRIAWHGLPPGMGRLEVYDLCGRLVRRLSGGSLPAESALAWDGRAAGGRPAAAGVYVFVLTHARGRLTGRVVLTR